jgi:hypothetical protein
MDIKEKGAVLFRGDGDIVQIFHPTAELSFC